MDKAFWKSIFDADCGIPVGHTAAELTPELLTFLGSTDMVVRDSYGYVILAQWMLRDNRYSDDELRAIRDQLLTNLQIGLGETGTDNVFLRSFSALALSLIIYRDNQRPFLTDAEVKLIVDHTIAYFGAEKDLRGYTNDNGWAHSTAHSADLFKFLARDPKTAAPEHQRILTAIVEKLLWPLPYVYTHGEDERLVSVLIEIFKRDTLTLEAWNGSLDKFAAWKQTMPEGDFQPIVHAPWLNSKHFLRSLYFRLEQSPELPAVASTLKLKVLGLVKLFGQ